MSFAGQREDEPSAADSSLLRDTEFALSAYRRMHFIRAFEQTCLDLSAASPPVIAGSIHLCAGQEAVPIGAVAALDHRDAIIATYRGHGWALAWNLEPYELLAEICHKADGINGGRAGSPLIMAPDRGFIGENSIVGAGVPIAAGVAMAEQFRGTGGVALVSFGDGATSQGALHEGMVFAVSRALPVVFILENNAWSEMTHTARIVPLDRLAKRASGYGMPGVTIDGSDPIAVKQTIELAVARARRGEGPSLIECRVPRLWGHYNRDIEHYRPKEDRAEAERRDPIAALAARLIASGVATERDLAALRDANEAEIAALVPRVIAAPLPAVETLRDHVIAAAAPLPGSAAAAGDTNSMTYIQAVNEALRAELSARPEVLVYGEDCGVAGGIFGATRYLQKEFGAERVFDTPIAESAILGSAIGAALRGLRPIVEIMWADFMLVALDQIINQAANVGYITRGASNLPLVIRTQQGATPGSCAQHSQSLEALLFHIPGLRLGLPADAQDAYDMLRAAVADPAPTIIIEARALYQRKSNVRLGGAVQAAAGARWRRVGRDLTIISWSTGIEPALTAAEQLSQEKLEVGVLDLRWLSPLDDDALSEAVTQGGGRILIVHEANVTGGVGAEISARIAERHGSRLRAPIRRIGAPDIRMPASPVLQAAALPSAEKIAEIARHMIGPRDR